MEAGTDSTGGAFPKRKEDRRRGAQGVWRTVKIIQAQVGSPELCDAKGELEGARPGRAGDTRKHVHLWELLGDDQKQRDSTLRETQGNNFPFLEVCLAAAIGRHDFD